jgi:hypothetical protein
MRGSGDVVRVGLAVAGVVVGLLGGAAICR